MTVFPDWAVGAAIVTWLITLLNRIVTTRKADEREVRKECRASLNALGVNVDQLLSVYLAYLTEVTAQKKEQARISIYSELNRLRRHVEYLETFVGEELSSCYVELFEAITGGDFESKVRKLADAGHNHATAAAKAETLIGCAESWFRKKYNSTLPSIGRISWRLKKRGE